MTCMQNHLDVALRLIDCSLIEQWNSTVHCAFQVYTKPEESKGLPGPTYASAGDTAPYTKMDGPKVEGWAV